MLTGFAWRFHNHICDSLPWYGLKRRKWLSGWTSDLRALFSWTDSGRTSLTSYWRLNPSSVVESSSLHTEGLCALFFSLMKIWFVHPPRLLAILVLTLQVPKPARVPSRFLGLLEFCQLASFKDLPFCMTHPGLVLSQPTAFCIFRSSVYL